MNILYDLDGTISDPLEGIAKCLNYALSKLGHRERELESLSKYIGPSLKIALSELLETKDDDRLNEVIQLYRERYIPIGFKENKLYPGIAQLLSDVAGVQHRQFIATSKRTDIAENVVSNFQLNRYFERVYGSDVGRSKTGLVEEILIREGLEKSETVMIGDRSFDIAAGNENGIQTIGVLWGYGSRRELEAAGANSIASTVEELKQTIMPNNKTPQTTATSRPAFTDSMSF